MSGHSVLDLNANYKQGEILNGKLDISLKNGELLPVDSKLVLENSGNIYEFNLKDIVSEQTSEGDFYITGKDISGSGKGYGKEGNFDFYPEVYFRLNVYSEEKENKEENTVVSEKTTSETPIEKINETLEDTSAEILENTITETLVEDNTEEVIENNANEASEEIIETPVEESVSETSTETPPESNTESAPITGNSVRGGIFSKLSPTGRATLELENQINGVVTKDKEFVYELKEGESVELEPLSVKTEKESLEDNQISIKREGNKVIVNTDYSEKKKGFGNDFIGNNYYKISIDLDKLNLNLEKGDLNLKLVYNQEEILSLNTILNENIVVDESVIKEPIVEEELNVSQEINDSLNISEELNQSLNETKYISQNDSGDLTIQEKVTLLSAFGNTQISVIKSELFKDRIIIGYKLGNYEIEYSYDSNLDKNILERELEKDRIKWLKDIANNLLEEESVHEKINISNISYNF